MSRLLALLTVVLVLSACTGEATPTGTTPAASAASTSSGVAPAAPPTDPPETTTSADTTVRTGPSREDLVYDHYVGTFEFGEGLELDVHAPETRGPWPVVVTVHGGGWFVGDRVSMGFLADGLAAREVVVFNASYRTISLGGSYPGTLDDIACAVAFARTHAAEYTTTPDLVVIVGHSAGAHLAALVAMAPGEFGGACGAPSDVDGFVGLAGPYDSDRYEGLLTPFFGVPRSEDPDTWRAGNPLYRAASSPSIPFLLLHGDRDELVPLGFSEAFADALQAEGLDVTFEVIPEADHGLLNAPLVVGDRIADFARTARRSP